MKLVRYWDRFWFRPHETLTFGVIRALTGLQVVCFCLLLAPYLGLWFTDGGLVTAAAEKQFNGPTFHYSLLFVWPGVRAAYILFGVLFLAGITLMLGLFSRLSCIIVFICLVSFAHRDLVILNSGDTMLKLLVFYLMLGPCGASFSLDAVRRRRVEASGPIDSGQPGAGSGSPAPHASRLNLSPDAAGWLDRVRQAGRSLVMGPSGPLAAPWAQRLIQFQISIVYCSTVLDKLPGPSWRNGTALWYVNNLAEMQRFPLPGLLHTTFYVNLMTWGALLAEFSMGILVWFPQTRLLALLLGLLLHTGIEYSMNIPLFAGVMAVAYLSFLDVSALLERFRQTRIGSRVLDWRPGRRVQPSPSPAHPRRRAGSGRRGSR